MSSEVKMASEADVQAFSHKAAKDRLAMQHFDRIRSQAGVYGDRNREDETGAAVSAIVKGIEAKDIDQVPARVITKPTTLFQSHQAAYDAGQWIRARFSGAADAQRYCLRHGLIDNAMTTISNPSGGFLVPDVLETAIIELRESVGSFRRNATAITMGDGSIMLPRVAGEVSSYYVGETSTITPSDMTLNQIKLESKKLAVLCTMSSELSEDAVISVAEMISRSIAYQFALEEDKAGFLGDGTSTYGGMVGLASALNAGSKYTATGKTTFSALTLSDFETVAGQAKVFGPNRRWYISNAGYYASMQRLMDAVGGVTMTEVANGVRTPSFLGYPVELVQVLESALTGTTAKPFAYFGDLSAGAFIGTRRGISIALDSSRYFEQDVIALRASQRFDINVHDRGTASASGGIVQMVFG